MDNGLAENQGELSAEIDRLRTASESLLERGADAEIDLTSLPPVNGHAIIYSEATVGSESQDVSDEQAQDFPQYLDVICSVPIPDEIAGLIGHVPLMPTAQGDDMIRPVLGQEEIDGVLNLLGRLPASFRSEERSLIMQAFLLATYAHREVRRKTGEPYIMHPLAVATILAELQLDPETVAGALLHDVAEDTDFDVTYLGVHFPANIAMLVDGVTKLKRIDELSNLRQKQADAKKESLRKMFLAMVEDVRVVLIKLADRVHNMRTLDGQSKQAQERISRETLEIFAPLANRLGIWQIKWELEDLSFRYLEEATYRELSLSMDQKRAEREDWVTDVKAQLHRELSAAGVEAEISGRPKHIYSIYRKIQRKGIAFEQIYDIHGFRVTVHNLTDCYAALGVVHSRWRPIPGEFDDYIANPKDNLYQSLHTAVLGPGGRPMEVQIRTHEMHHTAEYGIAAHWRYKEQGKHDVDFGEKIAWIRALMEWRQDVTDADEFVDGMKTDVFQDRVYAFTPQGEVIDLPAQSTPVDFAYHIHTELGHRCRGARVNGKLVPLDYRLQNGDQVEVIVAKRGGPSRDWLNPNTGYVVTQRARGKVRNWFRKQAREATVQQGRQIVERELKRLSVGYSFEAVAKLLNFDKLEDFFAAVGYGDVNTQYLAQKVLENERREQEENMQQVLPKEGQRTRATSASGVYVLGQDGMLAKPAGCCKPVPGDVIVGYVTRGSGVTIHKSSCPNIVARMRQGDDPRLVEVQWDSQVEDAYPVGIEVWAYDRSGLLRDVSSLVADEKINMRSAEASSGLKDNLAMIYATLEIQDISQLTRVMTKIERLPNVVEVRRRAS